jgi:mannitol-specific phosphotransferase system IIBC component
MDLEIDLLSLFQELMKGNFTNAVIVDLAIVIIALAVFIIFISTIIFVIRNRKTKEEKTAKKILKDINKIREKKIKPKKEKPEPKKEDKKNKVNELNAKKDLVGAGEKSLKQMLIEKFQKKIEKQLHSKIEIKDFKAKGDNFLVKILIEGHNLELVLDSSGKIIDYKNLDNE